MWHSESSIICIQKASDVIAVLRTKNCIVYFFLPYSSLQSSESYLIRKVWPCPCLISPWIFRLTELTSLVLNKSEIQLASVTTDAGKISLLLSGECSNLAPISLLLGKKTNWNIIVLINRMKVALVLNFLLRNPSKCLAQKPMVSNFMCIQF